MRTLLLALLLAAPVAAQSPLHTAVSDGDADLVASLLADGADPNDADAADGESLLAVAVGVGSLPVFRLLLHAGADMESYLDAWDDSSDGDLGDLLVYGGVGPAVDLLEAYPDLSFASYAVLPEAASRGDADAVARLLVLGAEANLESRTRSYLGANVTTPLLLAARPAAPVDSLPNYDPAAVVRLLVEAGADPNVFGSSGEEMFTPLHEAAENGRFEIVAELLRLGADPALMTGVEMSSREPRTALQVARDRRDGIDAEMARFEGDAPVYHYPTATDLDAVIALLE